MLLKPKYIYTILYASIIFLALVLRFYNFFDTVSFRGDHPRDLYIARSAADDGHPLLVGPQLSVQSVNIPSTYYDFLSWVYGIFRSPQGVTFAFACMNLLAMYCMVRLAILLIGKEAGLIMAFIFSVSGLMVSQSRMMWQPYPLTLGIALSLLLLLESFQRKSVILFYLSLLSYTFALSVYISPILLLPYYIYMGARFFKSSCSYPYVLGILTTGVSLFLAAMPFFGPYLYYERLRGFPSYVALQSPAFGAAETVQRAYDMYIKYAAGFIDDLFNFSAIKTFNLAGIQNYINWMLIILIVAPQLFRKYFRGNFDKAKNSVTYFSGLPWLLMGSFIILWFQKTLYTYRIHVFTPFFLLGFTFPLYLAVRSRRNIFSLVACTLLLLYALGNLSSIQSSQFDTAQGEVERAARAAMIIGYDAARSGIRTNDIAVGVSYNYPIFPFLYYLRDFANYTLPYVPGGNIIDQRAIDYPNTHRYFYMICVEHGVPDVSMGECEGNFLGQNPGYIKLLELPVNDRDTVMKFSIIPDRSQSPGI